MQDNIPNNLRINVRAFWEPLFMGPHHFAGMFSFTVEIVTFQLLVQANKLHIVLLGPFPKTTMKVIFP